MLTRPDGEGGRSYNRYLQKRDAIKDPETQHCRERERETLPGGVLISTRALALTLTYTLLLLPFYLSLHRIIMFTSATLASAFALDSAAAERAAATFSSASRDKADARSPSLPEAADAAPIEDRIREVRIICELAQ